MLSATMPDDVRRLAVDFLDRRHVVVQAGVRGASVSLIQQRAELLQHEALKMERLVQLVGCGGEAGQGGQAGLALVFTNTIPTAKKVRFSSC